MTQLTERQLSNFWDKVDKSNIDSCWAWTGAKMGDFGYGGFKVDGTPRYAHIVSWEIENGPVPSGLCVLHSCDNPRCVRPKHLFIGTKSDNMIDKVMKGRQLRGEQTFGAVLTDEDVACILRRFATGSESALALAVEFGVRESTMRAVLHGKTWRHIEGPRLSRAEILSIGKRNRAESIRASKKHVRETTLCCLENIYLVS